MTCSGLIAECLGDACKLPASATTANGTHKKNPHHFFPLALLEPPKTPAGKPAEAPRILGSEGGETRSSNPRSTPNSTATAAASSAFAKAAAGEPAVASA